MTERIGVWIVGAKGAVSACAITGALAVRSGRLPVTGMVSELGAFAGLGLASLDRLVFGGHDIRDDALLEAVTAFDDRARVLPRGLLDALAPELRAVDANLRPGIAAGQGGTNGRDRATPAACAERVQRDIAAFREREGLARVIVVNLASVESPIGSDVASMDRAALEAAMAAGWDGISASMVYAYAAVDAGHAFVNFTPSPGLELPALAAVASERQVPFAGNDGKTGETLLKTVLAPMFVARNLKLRTWFGYNMLGNEDGAMLADPARRESKIRAKDAALRDMVPDPDLASKVSIDYAPSLHDWKTAWDFVHFEGFLGARMSLQFTWQGCDSALAAPLVLDLVRFTDLAVRRGEHGPLRHLASFFKRPLGTDEHAFHAQFRALLDYASTIEAASAKR